MHFNLTHLGVPVPGVSNRALFEGDSLDLPGTQRSVVFSRFAPTIDKQSGLPAADPRVNDPGVVIALTDAGSTIGQALVPLHTAVDLGDGWRLTPANYVLYSGFQYRYDPGMPLVGIGAFVLLAGLIVSFYFVPARLFVRVDEAGANRTRVGLAATTVKGYDVFEDEFGRLVLALTKEPEKPGGSTAGEPDWGLAPS
jgi:cytochrome c biogenesis protein ResB